MLLFSLGALPTLARIGSGQGSLDPKMRPLVAVFASVVLTVVAVWFPMTAWFSGVLLIPVFSPLQVLLVSGLSGLASGILAARISRSVKVSVLAGIVASLYLVGSFSTLSCPMCNRGLFAIVVPSWGFFSLVGGLLELGRPTYSSGVRRFLLSNIPTLRQIALAAVIALSLSPVVVAQFWDPSVLYAPSISPDPGPLFFGLPVYRPYIAGYYDSIQYRICCLEIGVSFSNVNTALIGPGNFLMAGMGVQSPNCCVDGWDFGWRADVFLLSDGTLLVSADSWETCDSNANCGGHFWQHLRYHSQRMISPPDLSTPIFLRMMWEAGRVNWYYNHSGTPWQQYGSFSPDWREGTYFDIGVVAGGYGNYPYQKAFFFQFGVASKTPVTGWTIALLYPSFQIEGEWRLMEKAAIIQGDHSYWKVSYRWGGAPYLGVTARANALDPSFEKNKLELSYTGGRLRDNTPLW